MSNYTWNEANHPRDDEGKFTYKNGTSSHNSTKDRIEKQNKEREEFERAAEILYPTMKTKKDTKTGAAADVKTKPNTQLGGNIAGEAELKKIYDKYKSKYGVYQNPTQIIKHELKNAIGVDHIDNPIVKIGVVTIKGREAAENLHMSKADSYMNTDYARQNKIFNNCQELNKDLRTYFEEKISSQIGEDKIKDTKGIFIDAESSSSKDMSNELTKNQEFIQKVSELQKQWKLVIK